jgi:hypothetical protein
MANAKKEGKPKRNRGNLAKRLKIIQKNKELINEYQINL